MALHLVDMDTPDHTPLYDTTVAYVHIWPKKMDVYLSGAHGSAVSTALPAAPTLDLLLQTAKQLLARRGLALGVDGWRAPLDPNVGLVATAHLVDSPRTPLWGMRMNRPAATGRGPGAGPVVKPADTN